MAESQLKSRLRALMQEVVEAAQEADGQLRRGQRAVAIYNTERDDRVTALPSFAGAVDELASAPQFVAAAGRENASRIVSVQVLADPRSVAGIVGIGSSSACIVRER